ncbi:MAG: TolC family protein [Gemmataceae bacterium]|nr:TolC family protein [Gemmataceae bacterium]
MIRLPAPAWRVCLAALLLPLSLRADPPAGLPALPAAKAKTTLGWCIAMAQGNQPRLAAARASLASAEKVAEGLEALRAPDLIVPELPFRREQSALGVGAARAALAQAERHAAWAVTRAWLAAGYARSQEKVADGVVERLAALRDAAKQQLDDGARDVSANDVDRATVYLNLAETRRTEARQGVKRALASLREAIGAGPDLELDGDAGNVPDAKAEPALDRVLGAALAAREELVLADSFAQIVCLESKAQATSLRKRMETFAAGADIHAPMVPQESRDGEYRPGALQPEMPILLVGPKAQRVERAKALYARAAAGAAVARNLIALEAEDAFLRWQQAAKQAAQAKEAAEAADRLADNLRKDFLAMQKVRAEEVTTAQVTAATARGQLNEYLYRKASALADLERATAGQFCAKLAE